MTDDRPTLVFVLGAGHCGSTLLSLLLNGHPDVVALSELYRLRVALREGDEALETAAWGEIRRCYEARGHGGFDAIDFASPSWRTFMTWTDEQVRAWAAPRASLLGCVAGVTGARVAVDASKAWQQLYLLERSGLFNLRVLHLVRDGRGIVHAYQRKYGDLRHGLGRWLKPSLAAPVLARRIGADRWMRVRYEDLASKPTETLPAICRFIGVDYDPSMLEYRRRPWLGIGGNRMSKRDDQTIRLDERWRRDMSPRDRLVVDLVGGGVNRYYGY